MKLENIVVFVIVGAAALFAAWRLAGPFGRQRILRQVVALLTGLGAQRAAARIAATHDRMAAASGGSPCANCGPGAQKLHSSKRGSSKN
ncbi:MAG: hypothetical protein ABIT36_13550 [Steroidobacteraceae bacterium]